LQRVILRALLQPGIQCGQSALAPLLEPERLNPDLPRDGLDRVAVQQPQDYVAFSCRAPALHRLARHGFYRRRHHDSVWF
jgi:hypothetical protein